MKLKSISAENLGNIVKQMINTALGDSDQVAKLHQAIYEEWYLMKMMELDVRDKTKNADVPGIGQFVKKSYTKVKSRSKNVIQEISSYSSSNLTRNTLSRSRSMDALNNTRYLPKRDLSNIEINNCDKSSGQDAPVMCNKSVETNVCIEHDERSCEISAEQKCTISNNTAPSQEIIEVWNSRMRGAKIKKKPANDINEYQPMQQNKGKLVKRARKLSFDSWKKEKNLVYGKLLKEAEEKKQRELRKRMKDIEHKKASQEAYAQITREKEARQRELSAKLQAIRQMDMEVLQKQIDERRVINAQAFDAWRRQKNIKLREAKLMTMENAPQLKRSAKPISSSSQFNSWLNQLNNVLHDRYLRERRHLVRSFYCRPAYYSAAAIYAAYK